MILGLFVTVFYATFDRQIARTFGTHTMPEYDGKFPLNSNYAFSHVIDIGANLDSVTIADQFYDNVDCVYYTDFYVFDLAGSLITSWSDDTLGRIGGMDMTEDGRVVLVDESNLIIVTYDSDGSNRSDRGLNLPSQASSFVIEGLTLSQGGDVYVGVEYTDDTEYNKIYKYSRNGEFVTSWGERGTGLGQFSDIIALNLDSDGYIYVLDEAGKVAKFTPDGTFVYEFNHGIVPNPGESIVDIAIDNTDTIMVSYQQYVYLYDQTGGYIDRRDISTEAYWGEAVSWLRIDVNSDGEILIGDDGNQGIYYYDDSFALLDRFLSKISWEGGIIPSYTGDGDMVIDANGNLFFTNNLDKTTVYNSEGILIDALEIYAEGGMDFDNQGNLYYVDSGNFIRQYDSNRNPISTWGNQGLGNDIEYAEKIAISPDGYIYLTDPLGCYYKVDNSHNVIFKRCNSEIDGQPNLHTYITDLVFDSQGNYYIIFNENDLSHVSAFTSEDVFIESWGSEGTADDQFNYVSSMTIDHNDDLWVADTGADCIKRFTTDGEYTGKICDYDGNPFETVAYIMYQDGVIYVADASTREIVMFSFDTLPPEIDIVAPTKNKTATITDTTIEIYDNRGLLSEDIVVDNASTADYTNLSCQQVDPNNVSCTINITSSGNLIINAIDIEGNLATLSENGYVVDLPPVPVILTSVDGVTGFADNDTLTFSLENRSPVIVGVSDPDTTIFFLAGTNRYQATPDAGGNFTLTLQNPRLPQGSSVSLLYWARDGSRSLSTVKTLNITVTAPDVDTAETQPIYQYLYLPKGAQRPSGTTPIVELPTVVPDEQVELPTIVTEEETIPIPTRRLPNTQVENIGTNWITSEQTQEIAMWSAGGAVVSFTVAMILGESNPVAYVFRFITYAFGWLKVKKKHNSFIVVYDAVTKEPISLAIIRFIKSGGGLVDTQVTNEYGVVDVALPDGEYNLVVAARDYKYPTSVITVSNDEVYENIYRGGKLNAKEGIPLNISIPLDPILSSDKAYNVAKFRSVLANMVEVLQYLLLVVGFIFAGIAYLGSSTTLNLVVLALYFLIIIINIYIAIKGNKNYGQVKDTYGNFISGMTLSLVENKYDRVTAVRVTDKKGKYRFVVPQAEYSIKSSDEKYRLQENIIISKSKESTSSLLINKNILVERISK